MEFSVKQLVSAGLLAVVLHGAGAIARAAAPATAPATAPASAPSLPPITMAPVGANDDAVVAHIGDQTISMRELTGPLIDARGLNIAINLARLKLAEKAAQDAKVTVTEADVVRERDDTLKKMFGDADVSDYPQLYQQFLKQQGVTAPEFDIIMRLNSTYRKVAEPMLNPQITEDSLHEAFNALYGEKVKVRMIECSNLQEVQAAKKALDTKSFEDVAREMSRNAATRSSGGDVPAFSRATADLPEAFKSVAFALKDGEVSDPVSVGAALYLIKLEKRLEPTAVKFEDVKESIRNQIHEQAVQATVNDLRRKGDLEVSEALKFDVPVLEQQLRAERNKANQSETEVKGDANIRERLERERKRLTAPDDSVPGTQSLPAPGTTEQTPVAQ